MDDNQNTSDTSETPDAPESEGYCVSIEFEFDELTRTLSAAVCESATAREIDLAHINRLVSDGGWTSYYFRDGALEDLMTKIEAGKHGTYEVAQRLDATVSVSIADDLMSATISSTKPYGGAEMNQTLLETSIADAGIDPESCDEGTIREILAGKVVVDCQLAAGVEPEQGADAFFEPLVEGIVRRAPRSDEIGNVDQYDLTDFVVVEAGTELMRRHSPTQGVAGVTVTGVSIPATPGADVPFFSDLVSAVISDTDPNVLIAEIKGHPIATSNSVRVDPMLKVKDVDLRSGNIEFDGSVEIAGDVRSGVTIDATGDVFVKGVVEAATIIAGNDLLIASGIFKQGDDKSDGEATTRLTAGGTIEARFVSGAILRAGKNVVIKEYIGHCDTYAEGKVLVGQGGGKGQVFGGTCFGVGGIVVNRLGSDASVETLVAAGKKAHPSVRKTSLIAELNELAEQQDKLDVLADQRSRFKDDELTPQQRASFDKVVNAIDELGSRTSALEAELAALQAELDTAHVATVSASKAIRANVTVQINEVQRTFKNQANPGCYQEQDGKVVLIETQ